MEVFAASILASDRVPTATVISIFGFKSAGALEFQYARTPQALPTNLASALSPVDADRRQPGGNKKGRQTSPSFGQEHLISLSCALSSSNKSLKAKSFVSPYPTTVLASLIYFLLEKPAIGHPSTERTRCEPQPGATKSAATSLPDNSSGQ